MKKTPQTQQPPIQPNPQATVRRQGAKKPSHAIEVTEAIGVTQIGRKRKPAPTIETTETIGVTQIGRRRKR